MDALPEVDFDVVGLKVCNVLWFSVFSGVVTEACVFDVAWVRVLLGKFDCDVMAGLLPLGIRVEFPLNKIPGCLRP